MHTPSTGSVELAYATGQYWFDQVHRFVITVSSPGSADSLNLISNTTQAVWDEAGGYDNFLVTAFPPLGTEITAVAENFATVDGDSGGVTTSVLTSDTLDNAAASLNDVTISAITSSAATVTLNAATGIISVAANTPAGTYTVDYTICENINPANCSTVTETVTVTVPAASLAMTKTAGNPGPYKAGDTVTYTYTVTNTGGQSIRNVAITDTHNGSGPAPVPNNEALLTDAAPLGDSTDTAVDGNWEVLGPGNVITFTGTYTVTQIDVDNL